MRTLLTLAIIFSFSIMAYGQKDKVSDSSSLKLSNENKVIENIQTTDSTHSPRLAALYSAVIPGMGQFYNEKYWKIPIVYALGFLAASQIKNNHQNYLLFRNVSFILVDGNPDNDSQVSDFTDRISTDAIERRYARFKRDRDYWIILAGIFYVLNIVDATVDAHLREFSINESLSLDLSPTIQSSPYRNMQAGLSLRLRIK